MNHDGACLDSRLRGNDILGGLGLFGKIAVRHIQYHIPSIHVICDLCLLVHSVQRFIHYALRFQTDSISDLTGWMSAGVTGDQSRASGPSPAGRLSPDKAENAAFPDQSGHRAGDIGVPEALVLFGGRHGCAQSSGAVTESNPGRASLLLIGSGGHSATVLERFCAETREFFDIF